MYDTDLGTVHELGHGCLGCPANNLGTLPAVRRTFLTSRFGTAVPLSRRPPAITGKPRPPSGNLVTIMPVPRPPSWRIPWERGTRLPLPRRRPNKAAVIRMRQQFVNWIKQWAPPLYARAKKKADQVERDEATLGQLGGWWETFTENLTEIGGAVLQYKTQKAILDAQLERMRAGLPPLQTSEYAPTVAVKVDPGTTREITGAIGAGFGKMLPFIAIAGVGVLLMMRRR